MLNRLKGALLLLPLLLVILVGGVPLYITSAIISYIGLKEVYSSFKDKNITPINLIGNLFILGLLAMNIFNLPFKVFLVFCIALFILASLSIIFTDKNILDLCVTVFGLFYVTLPFQAIVVTHKISPINPNITWLIFIIAFSTDIFAYLSGKYFGKNKLIPKVSPNKTIEGSLGGILGSAISTSIYCAIFKLNLTVFIPVAILGSILAQIGDLFASSIKRYNNLKDFGNLIPGHGGIIDRFDSIIFVSIVLLSFTLLFF